MTFNVQYFSLCRSGDHDMFFAPIPHYVGNKVVERQGSNEIEVTNGGQIGQDGVGWPCLPNHGGTLLRAPFKFVLDVLTGQSIVAS